MLNLPLGDNNTYCKYVMAKNRYLVPPLLVGLDDRLAVDVSLSLSKEDRDVKEIIFLTRKATDISPLRHLAKTVDVSKLKKGLKYNGIIMRHAAMTTFMDKSAGGQLVLTLFEPDNRYLDQVDDFANVKHLIVAPGQKNDVANWIRRWEPNEVHEDEIIKHEPKYEMPSIIVMKALDELSATTNGSSQYQSLGEKVRVKTFARALFKFEPNLDPEAIESYLLHTKQWRTAHARDLSDLLRKLLEGGHFKGGERSGLAEYYKKWLEQAS